MCGGGSGGDAWSGAMQQDAELSLMGRFQHNYRSSPKRVCLQEPVNKCTSGTAKHDSSM